MESDIFKLSIYIGKVACKLYLGDEGLHAGHVVNVPLHNYRLKTLKIIFYKLNREHLKLDSLDIRVGFTFFITSLGTRPCPV